MHFFIILILSFIALTRCESCTCLAGYNDEGCEESRNLTLAEANITAQITALNHTQYLLITELEELLALYLNPVCPGDCQCYYDGTTAVCIDQGGEITCFDYETLREEFQSNYTFVLIEIAMFMMPLLAVVLMIIIILVVVFVVVKK